MNSVHDRLVTLRASHQGMRVIRYSAHGGVHTAAAEWSLSVSRVMIVNWLGVRTLARWQEHEYGASGGEGRAGLHTVPRTRDGRT